MIKAKTFAKTLFIAIVEELWGPEAPLTERAELFSIVWWIAVLSSIGLGIANRPHTLTDFFFLLLPVVFVTLIGVLFSLGGLCYAQYNYMKNKPR